MLTIQELEAKANIPRRTIHFYIKEGLIPPPEGSRRNAQYGEEHLLRLQLIQILKEGSHLRLEGIREILDGKSVGEMRAQIAALESELIDPLDLVAHTLRPPSAPEALKMALFESLTPPDHSEMAGQGEVVDPEEPAQLDEAATRLNPVDEDSPEISDMVRYDTPLSFGEPIAKRSMGIADRLRSIVGGGGKGEHTPESWRRVRVSDDVEIHYRDTNEKKKRALKIEKLIALAREILED